MPQMTDMRPKSSSPRCVIAGDLVAMSRADGRTGSAAPSARRTIDALLSDFLGDTRDLLRRSPDVLRALLTGLPDTWTTTPTWPTAGARGTSLAT